SNGQPALNQLVQADESATTNKQDISRIDLRKLLMGMFSAALGRNISDGPFQHLQKGLLDTLTRDVACDRGFLVLPADLVDFIYIDDAGLCARDVTRRVLDQPQDDVF